MDTSAIAEVFRRQGWSWNQSDKPPTSEDIAEMVKQLSEAIVDRGPGTSIESGRILVKKEPDGLLLVYLNFGKAKTSDLQRENVVNWPRVEDVKES